MARYVALLRAVNVGETGKLPMSELKAMCCDAGFALVETYIASGNVVFESKVAPSKVNAELEDRLHAYIGKPVGVMVRSAAEMLAVLNANPFPNAEPKHAHAIFLDKPPPVDALADVSRQQDEQLRLGKKRNFRSLPRRHGPLETENPSR